MSCRKARFTNRWSPCNVSSRPLCSRRAKKISEANRKESGVLAPSTVDISFVCHFVDICFVPIWPKVKHANICFNSLQRIKYDWRQFQLLKHELFNYFVDRKQYETFNNKIPFILKPRCCASNRSRSKFMTFFNWLAWYTLTHWICGRIVG